MGFFLLVWIITFLELFTKSCLAVCAPADASNCFFCCCFLNSSAFKSTSDETFTLISFGILFVDLLPTSYLLRNRKGSDLQLLIEEDDEELRLHSSPCVELRRRSCGEQFRLRGG